LSINIKYDARAVAPPSRIAAWAKLAPVFVTVAVEEEAGGELHKRARLPFAVLKHAVKTTTVAHASRAVLEQLGIPADGPVACAWLFSPPPRESGELFKRGGGGRYGAFDNRRERVEVLGTATLRQVPSRLCKLGDCIATAQDECKKHTDGERAVELHVTVLLHEMARGLREPPSSCTRWRVVSASRPKRRSSASRRAT